MQSSKSGQPRRTSQTAKESHRAIQDGAVLLLDIHQKIVLGKLSTAEGAAYDSHANEHEARCHPDTRVGLLNEIDSWAHDPNGECIFWLNGMAGTGKSTVSRTVAQNFASKGELGASFFFKRGEGDRGRAAYFFTTIAAQLVLKLPSLAEHVQDAIEADPTIAEKAMKEQFEKLVLQPLGKLANDPQDPLRIGVVIDALDECDREDVRLRFFATSRPDLLLRLGFNAIRGKYQDLVLQDIPEPIIEHDICTFLTYELARIRDDYNNSVTEDRHLSNWPGHTEIQTLVAMAIPLFIFAATACRFIKDRRRGDPDKQLREILKYEARSQASKLDATYRPVLDQFLAGLDNSEREEVLENFRELVGSIVILASPSPLPVSHIFFDSPRQMSTAG